MEEETQNIPQSSDREYVWVIVPLIADRAMIERRFDTRDWDASDYREAAEQYKLWIYAAKETP